jgi:LPXTG-motif cell wall-anchored protein
MSSSSSLYRFAAADYGCDSYGKSSFGNANCSTGTSASPATPATPASQSSPGGVLANTGYNILLPVAFGLALITAAIILSLKRWRRSRNNIVQ